MDAYDLIALDMDGTLLDSALRISPGNREAVRRAARRGKLVALSTGRCLAELRDVARELPEIRYMICENGSCVYDCARERDIHVDPLPPEEVECVLERVRGLGAVVQVFRDNQSYFSRADAGFADDYGLSAYRETFRRTAVFDERLFDGYRERPFRIEKLNLYFRDGAARARARALFDDRPLKAVESIGHLLEIVSELADKGRGLRKLCDHLGVEMSRTIAVGDSMNDVEILRAAGLAVAMGNACPGAKAAADVVAPDCDHDGVAWVIENYLLK